MKLILKWLICLIALLMTAFIFPAHVSVSGGIFALAAGATVLWLLNLFIKPLLQLVCLPATILTLGLFFFVANAWMVGLMDAILPPVHFDGFWVRLFAALLVSLGNAVLIAARRTHTPQA